MPKVGAVKFPYSPAGEKAAAAAARATGKPMVVKKTVVKKK